MSTNDKGTPRAQCTATDQLLDAVAHANDRLIDLGLTAFAIVIIAEWHYDPEADDDAFRAQLLYASGRVLCAVIARTTAVAGRMLVGALERDLDLMLDEMARSARSPL